MNRMHPEVGEWREVIAHGACNSDDPPILFKAKKLKLRLKGKKPLAFI